MMADELRDYLNTHWFKNGWQAMRAKVIVKKSLPDRDFNFKVAYRDVTGPMTTATEVSNIINNLKYGSNKMVQEDVNRG